MKEDITTEFYNTLINLGKSELAQLIENGEILLDGVDALIGYAGKTIELFSIIEICLPEIELESLKEKPDQKEKLEEEIKEYIGRNHDQVQEIIWRSL